MMIRWIETGVGGTAHDGSAGRRTREFFYSFNLDKVVPADHLVRKIDDVLDLGWVHKELAAYSHTRGASRLIRC